MLYDSGKHNLTHPKKLTPEQYREKAQVYFDQWLKSANDFLETFEFSFGKGKLHQAAFLLHQATERYYTTILLVFTDYRPKDHNLETLGIKVEMCDARFAVFPKTTDEEKHRFELLKRAYIDARYNMDEYAITPTELEYLAEKVEVLKGLTEQICTERILGIGKG